MRTPIRTAAFLALLSLPLAACMELPEDEWSEEELASTEARIKNGIYVGFRRGLLEIERDGGGFCTATMISDRWAITAAHCIRIAQGSADADAKMTVWYFDPDTETKRRVSNVDEVMFAHHIPTWDGPPPIIDYQDDLALIGRKSADWTDTSSVDYIRLNGGDGGGSVFNIGQIQAYGRGSFDDSPGTTSGVLRSFPVDVHEADKHWFYDLEGSRGICRGDSGGPYIGHWDDREVVAGVVAAAQIESDDKCTRDGGKQWAARVNSRIDWIVDKLDSHGVNCTKFDAYTKCF